MRWLAMILLMTLAGCGERRSFDERYNDTEDRLEQRAQAIENDLNQANAQGEGQSER